MSRVAAVVCEGPTDFYVIEQIVLELWPDVSQVLCLQPEVDAVGNPVDKSGGWSEVKAWSEANGRGLKDLLSPDFGDAIDLLILAMDVDIAVAAGIENPPARATPYVAKRLCDKVKSWLGAPKRKLPPELVIALPAMALEAWVIAALYPQERRPEVLPNPADTLADKGRLPRGKNGKPIKPKPHYRTFAKQIVNQLTRVRTNCPEAERLCSKIEQRRDAVEAA